MKKTLLLLTACFAWLSQNVWADNYVISSFSTNMGTYQSYTLDNLKDGDFNSKFWSNGNQEMGQYITADLGVEQPLQYVNLYFESGDQPNGGKVSISNDDATWEELGSFSLTDIGSAASNYLVSFSAANKKARYVRFEITNPAGGWFQMREFEIPIPDVAAPSRTISVGVNDEAMGKAYIGTEGTTSVTQEGIVVFTAVANDGYEFIGWTLDGVQVSTDAEFMDNSEGDKNYVANFILDVYSQFSKPGIEAVGNKRAQSKGEILNTNGVQEGSTLVFNPTGSNSYQIWANKADLVNIKTGATFDLKVTYGAEGWNDLSVFMLREDGSSRLLYGPYEGSWGTGNGGTANLFYSIQASEDMATADEFEGSAIFPITMPNDLKEGEVVLIRFLIHGADVGEDPSPSFVVEGNYCDYLFYTAVGGEETGIEALNNGVANVAAANGGVNIAAENATVKIYAINGALAHSANVSGTEFVSLPAGFYAVAVNGKAYKVLVK